MASVEVIDKKSFTAIYGVSGNSPLHFGLSPGKSLETAYFHLDFSLFEKRIAIPNQAFKKVSWNSDPHVHQRTILNDYEHRHPGKIPLRGRKHWFPWWHINCVSRRFPNK
jgi:hypothetical protein